jgi:hypothetical protein
LGGQADLRAVARVEPVPISLVASALNLHRPFRSSGGFGLERKDRPELGAVILPFVG